MARALTTFFALLFLLSPTLYGQLADSSGLYFQGFIDRITIDNLPAYQLDSSNFTIEVVMKADSSQEQEYPTLFSNRNTAGDAGITWFLDTNGTPAVIINEDTTWSDTSGLFNNQCLHMALVRENDSITFYVNATPIETKYNPNSINTPANEIWIGWDQGNAGNTGFKGDLKELRYWNTARSRQQLFHRRDTMITNPPNNLTGYWPMKEISDQTVPDQSAQNNNAIRGSTPSGDANDPDSTGTCSLLYPAPPVQLSGPANVCPTDTFTLRAQGDTAYWWSHPQTPEDTIHQGDQLTISGLKETTSYRVEGIRGRADTHTVNRRPNKACFPVEVFELISPNGDDKNQHFVIKNIERFPGHKVQVFNKSGERVFHSTNYKNSWQGKELPDGSYYYVVHIRQLNKTFKGRLVIKR